MNIFFNIIINKKSAIKIFFFIGILTGMLCLKQSLDIVNATGNDQTTDFVPTSTPEKYNCTPNPPNAFLYLPFGFHDNPNDWLGLMTSAFDHHFPDYSCSLGDFNRCNQDKDGDGIPDIGRKIIIWEGEVAYPVNGGDGDTNLDDDLCYAPGSIPLLDHKYCGWLSGYIGATGESTIYYDGHDGYDWGLSGGTDEPILAAASGKVSYISNDGAYGWTVELDHGNGYQTRYSHLQPNRDTPTLGACVEIGETIGFQGNSGGYYGVHLHFRVMHGGTNVIVGDSTNYQLRAKKVVDPFGWCYYCINPPPDPLQQYNSELSENLWYGLNPRSLGYPPHATEYG